MLTDRATINFIQSFARNLKAKSPLKFKILFFFKKKKIHGHRRALQLVTNEILDTIFTISGHFLNVSCSLTYRTYNELSTD